MQQQALLAILLSLFAGLSTTVGSLAVCFFHITSQKSLSFCLGLSAGVMTYISIADLMPSAITQMSGTLDRVNAGIFSLFILLGGVLLAALLSTRVPKMDLDVPSKGGVLRVGVVSAIGIMIHNFPEGIATFMASYHNIALGLPVSIAVAIHNIPEGIAIAIPVYYATRRRGRAVALATLSGITEPIGAILAFLVLRPFLSDFVLGIVFAAVAGIMLAIAFSELLPEGIREDEGGSCFYGVIAGMVVMALSLLFL